MWVRTPCSTADAACSIFFVQSLQKEVNALYDIFMKSVTQSVYMFRTPLLVDSRMARRLWVVKGWQTGFCVVVFVSRDSQHRTIPMFASAPLPCSLFFLLRATAFHSSLFYVSILLCLLSDSFQSLLISSRSLCNTALSIDTGFTKRATSLQHAVPWRRSTCVSMPTQARL